MAAERVLTLEEGVGVLVLGDGRSFPVIDTKGLRTLFSKDAVPAFNAGVRRLVRVGLLERLAHGVYLNKALPRMGLKGIGIVACHLRPNDLVYLSYESALADFGSISQIPMTVILATTGRRGPYSTPYGDIEFAHTSRRHAEILRRSVFDERWGMRVAEPTLAYEDLQRVRRNLHMVDEEMHAKVVAEWQQSATEQ